MLTSMKTKQKVNEIRDKNVNLQFTPTIQLVSDTVDTEITRRVNEIKTLVSVGKPYKSELIELTKYARETRSLNYYEIAELVDVPEMELYDIVFLYPVTPSKNGYKKNSLSREEKTRRDDAMVRLNTEEGLTLKQIALKFHITKQRVSAIFKDLSYTPINTQTLKTITAKKYAGKFKKVADKDMASQILSLKTELRAVKQRSAVAKYHYGKTVISLRGRLILQYMLRWDELTREERADYGAHKRVLEQALEVFKEAGAEGTLEKRLAEEILIRVQMFEGTNDEGKKLLKADLPTYEKIEKRISEVQ